MSRRSSNRKRCAKLGKLRASENWIELVRQREYERMHRSVRIDVGYVFSFSKNSQ